MSLTPYRPQEKTSDERRILFLEGQVDELQERIRQMEELLHPSVRLPEAWALTKLEKRLFQLLLARDLATYEQIKFTLRGMDQDEPCKCYVGSWLHKLRKKLSPHGVEIDTVWAEGARLRARLSWKAKLG